MPRLPWFKFFANDYIAEPELSVSSPATRGIYMDFLCALHSDSVEGRGRIRATPSQLCTIGRCQMPDLVLYLTEGFRYKFADHQIECPTHPPDSLSCVTDCPDCVITIQQRRMMRESQTQERIRKQTAARVARLRERRKNVVPIHRNGASHRNGTAAAEPEQASLLPVPVKEKPITPEEFLDAWNEIANQLQLPVVKILNDDRKRKLKIRLRKFPALSFWQSVFGKIPKSDWLTGKVQSRNGQRPFRITFDWIVRDDTNCSKVFEGNYDNDPKPQQSLAR